MEAPKWEIHLMPMNIGYNGLKYTDQYAFPEYKKDMPYLVDEFGGIKWNPSQQMESAQNTILGIWRTASFPGRVLCSSGRQVDAVLSLSNDIWGYCYTQLTDVEQEQNGVTAPSAAPNILFNPFLGVVRIRFDTLLRDINL